MSRFCDLCHPIESAIDGRNGEAWAFVIAGRDGILARTEARMNDDIEPRFVSLHCQHRWLIEVPNGPISEGRCTKCRLTRAFYNDPDAAMIGSHSVPPPLEPAALED